MSAETKIEWCDSTFNPWIGCTRVSPACDDCYAARSTPARTLNVQWGTGAPRRRTSDANWRIPEQWERKSAEFFAQQGRRRRVFCASLADVFDNEVSDEWRADLFDLICQTPNLDWLLLTKRIGNAARMIEDGVRFAPTMRAWPWHNVWLGATVVNQAEVDRDVPKLLATPAARRFLSIEPMLGPISFEGLFANPERINDGTNALQELDWIIVGGESGPRARAMPAAWARELRDQCEACETPFLFKQWGEWVPYEHSAQPPFLWSQHGHEIDGHALPDFESEDGQTQREWTSDFADMLLARRVGKKVAGRLLDGVEHNGFPESCQP